MDADHLPARHTAIIVTLAYVVGVAAVVGSAVGNVPPLLGAGVFAVTAFGLFIWRVGVRWDVLLISLIVLIWLVPIRRYGLPITLPFELEPYRFLAACVIGGWLTSLLIDRRVRLYPTGLAAPLSLVAFGTFASVVVNFDSVTAAGRQTDVTKALMFFVSFLLLLVCVRSVADSASIARLVQALVLGGAVIGTATLIEARVRYNFFDHLAEFAPFLREVSLLNTAADPTQFARSEYGRAYASAEHPIALGAVLVLVIPLAIHLLSQGKRRPVWAIATILLLLGALASVSRTPVTMLGGAAVVYAVLRPRVVFKLAPVVVPLLLVVIHFALPTTLGTLKSSFLPEGGLVAQQQASEGTRGQGRIADLGPAFDEIARKPVLGEGYSVRAVDPSSEDPLQILDNQWLGILLGTGVVGLIGWTWFFFRFIRRCGGIGRREGQDSSLATALTASVTAAAVGMVTFDAFAFVQWTVVLFLLLGIGSTIIGDPSRRKRIAWVTSTGEP